MSYQSGRMGAAEAIALAFTISFTSVFLTTPAVGTEIAGSAAWLSVLLVGIATVVPLWILIKILERQGGDLLTVAETLVGKPAAWLIGMYYLGLFFSYAVFWTRQFAENTLLTALPDMEFTIVTAWYIGSAAVLVYYGIESIARASYIILPFAILGLVGVLIMLVPEMRPLYLTPWLGTGLPAILTKSAWGTNAGVMILGLIAVILQNSRVLKTAVFFGLGSSILLKAAAVAVFVMVFEANAGSEKTLPFYEMARLIYLNRYVQRLEALFIMLWAIIGIAGIAISLYTVCYLVTRLGRLPAMRPIIPVLAIIIAQLAIVPEDIASTAQLENQWVQYYDPVGIFVIPIGLYMVSLLKGRGKKRCLQRGS
jgi:spore germination protein (amino acid permease)